MSSPPPPMRTIGRQILAGYLAVFAVFVVLVGTAVVALVESERAYDTVVRQDVPLIVNAHRLDSVVAEKAADNRGYLLTRDQAFLEMLDAANARFRQVMQEMEDTVRTDTGRERLADVRDAEENWDAAWEAIAAQAEALGPGEVVELADQRLFPASDALRRDIERVIEWQNRLIDEAVDAADRRANIAVAIVVGLGIVALAVALVVAGSITRRTNERLRAVALDIDSASTDILAGTSQQVTGAAEQAAAVQQTVTTVEELNQTASQSAERARSVAEGAQRSAEVAEAGTQALAATATGMEQIRRQVDSIAATVLGLTEHTQAISDIVDAVDDIAERTHLLALNASIEAARAGEHGRGFGVVAGEVRALADEARSATARVGTLLGEIQRGATTAAMATEEGTKSVADGSQRVQEARGTIRELAEAINAATLAAEQIAASAGQQAVATTQIDEGMRNIDEVMEQNLASARQMEDAARGLDGVAERLKALVGAG